MLVELYIITLVEFAENLGHLEGILVVLCLHLYMLSCHSTEVFISDQTVYAFQKHLLKLLVGQSAAHLSHIEDNIELESTVFGIFFVAVKEKI